MKKVAEFEKVSFEEFKKQMKTFGNVLNGRFLTDDDIMQMYNKIQIPKRATKGSAGHDISIPFSVNLPDGYAIKIPTGLRCKMDENYVMLIFIRSSLGLRDFRIKNQTGVIDSDYYYNTDNEGHIFVCIDGRKLRTINFKAGDKVAQAVFLPYGVADTEEITEERTGGFGSTTKDSKYKEENDVEIPKPIPVFCTHCQKLIYTQDRYCGYCRTPNKFYSPE